MCPGQTWSHGRPTQRPADDGWGDRERSRTKVVHHVGYTASFSRSSPPNAAGKALFRQSVWLSCFYDRLMPTHFLFLFAFWCFVEGNRLTQMLSNGTLACTVKYLVLILIRKGFFNHPNNRATATHADRSSWNLAWRWNPNYQCERYFYFSSVSKCVPSVVYCYTSIHTYTIVIHLRRKSIKKNFQQFWLSDISLQVQ